MDLKTNVEDLLKMIGEGKIMEAFEKYYAEDVTMQENETPVRVGKAANRAFEESFVGGITEVRGSKVLGVAYGDDYVAIESSMDLTHKDWGVMNKTQVSIQHWKDGKIVSEKFYYDTK